MDEFPRTYLIDIVDNIGNKLFQYNSEILPRSGDLITNIYNQKINQYEVTSINHIINTQRINPFQIEPGHTFSHIVVEVRPIANA